ncbi:PQQ-binding-like beta-propeller repeat protein [Haloarchaeobius sp. HRN-SO-5]|uniref:outer membrane protein assembly factor BamB family protein n=1 Tax=Haloarchaeobius sp. HRN-SO-5 TaxID=3446118 RepID=UPI003EBA0C84
MTPSRRRVLAATASALAAGLAGCTSETGPATDPTDTTEPPTGTTDPGDDSSLGDPEVLWTADVGPATTNAPLVVDGTVYVGSDAGPGIDSGDESGHHLHAFAATDGAERWSYETDKPVGGRPTVTADGIYVTGGYDRGTAGIDYELFALTRDGDERWRFVDDRLSAWYTVCGVVDGTVFVGSNDDAIGPGAYAAGVATDDGATRWTAEFGDVVGGLPLADRCLLPSPTGLHAVDSDGSVAWTYEGAEPLDFFAADPEVVAGSVLVEADGLVSLDPESGAVNWRYGSPESYVTRRVTVGDHLVARTYDGGLVSLDPATGDERWTDDGLSQGYGLAAVGDGRFAVQTPDAFEVRTSENEVVGSFEPSGTHPSVSGAGGALFVAGRERGRLDAYDADGEGLWTIEPTNEIGGFAAVDGTAYVTTVDGSCHALAL